MFWCSDPNRKKNRLKMLRYESLFFFGHLSGLYRYIVFAIWCWSSKSLTLKLLDRNSELWKIEKVAFLTRGFNKRKVFSPLEQSTNKRKKLRQSNYKLVDHVVFRWFLSKRSQNAPIDGAWMKTKVVWFAKELVFNEFQSSDAWVYRWKERYATYFISLFHYFKYFVNILLYFSTPVNISLQDSCIPLSSAKITGFSATTILQELNSSNLRIKYAYYLLDFLVPSHLVNILT